MLSKYKITRQIPLTTTYYDATNVVLNPGTYAYRMNPTSGQGQYANINPTSKGYMISGDVDAIPFIFNGNLITSIQEACAAAGGAHMLVLRDMGKTVYVPYWTINLATIKKDTKGYFRLVQLISPTSLGPNGWNGGPQGSTFGVKGYPIYDAWGENSTNYLTFYIPVSIANIIAEGATSTQAFAIAGGQM